MQRNPRGPAVMYDIRPIKRPVPGKWYVGFVCRSCERPFAVLSDEGRDSVGPRVERAPDIQISCPHCETITSYAPQAMTRFQAMAA